MLKNQETEQPSPIPSSQAPSSAPRVTPDELNAALAAIEARKQAEAAHLAGTIALDQAVSELHLDSTPGEIWAEVQAQRAAAPQKSLPQTRTLPPKRARFLRGWPALIVPAAALWIVIGTVAPQLGSNHPSSAPPVVRSLGRVSDGTEVYADNAALAQIASGRPLSQITVSDSLGHNRWRLVKIGSHVYLRGCTAGTDSLQSLQGKPLNVYNDDNSGELFGESISNVTVRVDKTAMQKSGGDSDYSEVTLPNFQPDPFTTLDQ